MRWRLMLLIGIISLVLGVVTGIGQRDLGVGIAATGFGFSVVLLGIAALTSGRTRPVEVTSLHVDGASHPAWVLSQPRNASALAVAGFFGFAVGGFGFLLDTRTFGGRAIAITCIIVSSGFTILGALALRRGGPVFVALTPVALVWKPKGGQVSMPWDAIEATATQVMPFGRGRLIRLRLAGEARDQVMSQLPPLARRLSTLGNWDLSVPIIGLGVDSARLARAIEQCWADPGSRHLVGTAEGLEVFALNERVVKRSS